MIFRDEARSRKVALAVLGAMTVIWIALGGACFASDRDRPDPDTFSFRGESAVTELGISSRTSNRSSRTAMEMQYRS